MSFHYSPALFWDYSLLLTAHHGNLVVPDSKCFHDNVTSTYNVVEAACKLGVRKIIIASSDAVYGVTYAQGDADFESIPIDEDDLVNPGDTYVPLAASCLLDYRGTGTALPNLG